MGRDRRLWTLLETGSSRGGLAPLLQRQLAAHRGGLVLGKRRAVGLGHVSLWTLGFHRAIWLVLGAADAMGTGLGFVAQRWRLRRLGPVAPISAHFGKRWRLRRLGPV